MNNTEIYKAAPENSPAPNGEVQAEAALDYNPSEIKDASSLHSRLQKTKTLVRGAVIAAELAPITNEGLRFGAFGATMAETHSPALGAAVLGSSTLLVEGAGAMAAAGMLAGEKAGKVVKWANRKSQKIAPPGSEIPRVAEAGIAYTVGTPVLMTLKTAAEPERTLEQNRRYGIFTASWMAGVFAAEGGLLGNSVEHYNDPKLWAASVVALGGLAWAAKKSKSFIKKGPNNWPDEELERANGQVKKAAEVYQAYHDSNDESIRLGLFGEDLEEAITNPETISFTYKADDGAELSMPMLVPAESLEWYDAEVLGRTYGEGKKFYCYIHPPLPADSNEMDALKIKIKEVVDSGAIIITDQYESQPGSLDILKLGGGYSLDTLGTDEGRNENNAFAGIVKFEGVEEIKPAPRLYEIYQSAVQNGELAINNHEGLAMVDVFGEEEIGAIWEMYNEQFSRLGENDPSPAGFDKAGLAELMQSPDVAKVVFRKEGRVVSLCFFNQDFKVSPWFNRQYYEKHYPEYAATDNIVMFPGIVSDESQKGSSYSGLLVDFAMNLYKRRGSNAMLTFECTQVSSRYIPRIVKRAINNGGHGIVSGLEAPISTTVYRALRKST